VPSGAGAHLGLGGAALRAAVARKLGRRRLRRPTPLRPLVATSRRVAHPAEPARRADADASLSALPLLRIHAAVPQRRLPAGRRGTGRGGHRSLSGARSGATAQRGADHRLRPGVRAQVEGAREDLSRRTRTRRTGFIRAPPGMRVGAPPDEFFRDGQDWGLPPLNPWKLSQAQWMPFIEAIRTAGRHAAGIRLDHVMGLFRLFWIPDGMDAAQGAYVRYPASTLLSLLANESRRARAVVIGEDLGLVQPVVRTPLKQTGSVSSRLAG